MHRLRVLVLSLMACLSLGAVLSTSAWASGPPENTVLPALQFSVPKLGTTYTTTRGTWTNEPTAYAYQWERCNPTGGECAAITGGTEKNYKVIPADQGHSLRVTVTASNAAGKGSATSAASKMVAKGPEFISSEHVYPVHFSFETGNPVFEDAGGFTLQCTSMSGSGNFTSSTEISGASMTLTGCRGGTQECKSFETVPLHGYLAYLSAASKTVALVLEGEGSPFATFRCDGSLAHLQGRLIGQITPVNFSTTVYSLAYSLERGGVEKPNALESGVSGQLEWIWNAGLEKWGLGATNGFGTSRKGEIVA